MFKGKFSQIIFTVFLAAILIVSAGKVQAQEAEISEDPAVIEAGSQLFNTNCKVCHNVHQRLVGPALADVYNRAPSIEWLKTFIKNPGKVINSGDEYAVALFDEYKTEMQAFPFEDDQIMAILAYIKDETNKGPVEEAVAAETTDAGVSAEETSYSSDTLDVVLIGLIVVLVLILGVLIMIVKVMKKYLYQQKEVSDEDKEIIDQSFSLVKMFQSKPVVFLTIFIITALIAKGVINGLYSVGIQKGYAPTQPIAYSHARHAGDFGIDCNYCHTGVRKSKSANIPSPNICMNCHSSILTESEEIKKIYAAIEKNEPIEWVRVHNLPDLVYFNHSQHVEVGGVDCQTCHGPVETMEVVEQQELLTMGWCVECHRTTNVDAKDNAYYDRLIEYHNSDEITVEDNGGLDCAKCHY